MVESAAGIVLAGGRSVRMGTSKSWLDWHGSTLLYRAAAVLGRSVRGPVVVVRAADQELPELPVGVTVLEDPVSGLGPMQGVAAGLAAMGDAADAAFVCSTDMPFLHPAFVTRVLRALAESDSDMVLPFARGYRQPLAAGYRTALAPRLVQLLAEGKFRPAMLPEHCAVTQLDEDALLADPTLARLDPELSSVINVNTPEELRDALARPLPEVTVGARTLRAATLGAAVGELAAAVVELNGVPVRPDPALPLVAGDRLSIRAGN